MQTETASVTFEDGARYVGGLLNGEAHGRGVVEWPAFGERYEGGFRAGFLHGHGVFRTSSGTVVEGQWDNGNPVFGVEGNKAQGAGR